ncbi:UDP-glucose 4-epimerase GalE [Aquipuribacter nitratireducens]|uniref:UDP-glucose 4-epimerase n=1 Tax=Aquipuribacter nitratireducens TaxID=650104 RepID=A0ABW0GM72_9MICO
MTIAVTGAAGYIGSHVAHLLREQGAHVLAVDDMSAGIGARVDSFPLVEIDLARDEAPGVLRAAFAQHQVRAVVHLAARKAVGESVEQPARYYHQNVAGLANLLTAMQQSAVDRLVFSSSAATYGMPDVEAVDEDLDCRPINPYGETKLVGEWLVRAAARATGLRAVCLRYFNVAGAGRPELGDVVRANLIPLVLDRVEQGLPALVFGDDYPTPDGTCIRDYVHVADLADAHARALAHLEEDERPHDVLNVGTGRGASVLEVVAALAEALGREVPVEVAPRRAGDPPRLVASVDRIHDVLGWRAARDLADICASAVEAERHRAGN